MIAFGREVAGRLEVAERREWLCANGLGGFASGTVAGLATRRYHGLLIGALQPPGKRDWTNHRAEPRPGQQARQVRASQSCFAFRRRTHY